MGEISLVVPFVISVLCLSVVAFILLRKSVPDWRYLAAGILVVDAIVLFLILQSSH
jgi:hypothetical protein